MKKKNKTNELTKCFCCAHTDDQCFYVGLGQRGQPQTARKANFLGSDEYRPFQCCPTKLERATKVPKMTAQRLAHSKTDRSAGGNKAGNFHFQDVTQKPAAAPKAPKAPKNPAVKKVADVAPAKESTAKKAGGTTAKGKADKGQKGQKGLLGIGKVVNWL